MMCGHGAAGQTVFPKKIRPHPNPLSLCEQTHLERSFCSYHYIKDLELWSFRIWGGPYIQGADVLLKEKQREIGWAKGKALQKPPDAQMVVQLPQNKHTRGHEMLGRAVTRSIRAECGPASIAHFWPPEGEREWIPVVWTPAFVGPCCCSPRKFKHVVRFYFCFLLSIRLNFK